MITELKCLRRWVVSKVQEEKWALDKVRHPRWEVVSVYVNYST